MSNVKHCKMSVGWIKEAAVRKNVSYAAQLFLGHVSQYCKKPKCSCYYLLTSWDVINDKIYDRRDRTWYKRVSNKSAKDRNQYVNHEKAGRGHSFRSRIVSWAVCLASLKVRKKNWSEAKRVGNFWNNDSYICWTEKSLLHYVEMKKKEKVVKWQKNLIKWGAILCQPSIYIYSWT